MIRLCRARAHVSSLDSHIRKHVFSRCDSNDRWTLPFVDARFAILASFTTECPQIKPHIFRSVFVPIMNDSFSVCISIINVIYIVFKSVVNVIFSFFYIHGCKSHKQLSTIETIAINAKDCFLIYVSEPFYTYSRQEIDFTCNRLPDKFAHDNDLFLFFIYFFFVKIVLSLSAVLYPVKYVRRKNNNRCLCTCTL